MSRRISFTKLENELVRSFREKINTAATAEDIAAAFSQTVGKLLSGALGEATPQARDAIAFAPKAKDFYRLDEALASNASFVQIMHDSDLPHILSRFAETANRRRQRILEHRERTEAKIRN
jgi:hypothetical protein